MLNLKIIQLTCLGVSSSLIRLPSKRNLREVTGTPWKKKEKRKPPEMLFSNDGCCSLKLWFPRKWFHQCQNDGKYIKNGESTNNHPCLMLRHMEWKVFFFQNGSLGGSHCYITIHFMLHAYHCSDVDSAIF